MAENDPDKLKGPGGQTFGQLHEQVRKSAARERDTQKTNNELAQKHNRWRRFVHYVWGRSGKR